MKIILFVVVILVAILQAKGQNTPHNALHGYVEVEVAAAGGNAVPQTKLYLTYAGKTKTGLYCWAQVSRSYSQIYCGPTYSPKSWLQIGGAVGLETAKNPFRTGAFVWVGKGKFSNLLVAEKGGSGSWFRNQASWQARKNLTLSLTTQRFSGTGPRVDISVPKTHLSVGAEYHFATRTTRFGVKYNF